MLCTNKLVCWFVSVFGKVTIWVVTIVVRWVYRIVCTVVKVLFGLVLAPFDKAATLGEGVGDVVELIKDVFYFTIGAVIYYGLYIVDAIQTGVGLQQRKRRLTPSERRTLYPIFRDSLVYDAIRVVEGNAGSRHFGPSVHDGLDDIYAHPG